MFYQLMMMLFYVHFYTQQAKWPRWLSRKIMHKIKAVTPLLTYHSQGLNPGTAGLWPTTLQVSPWRHPLTLLSSHNVISIYNCCLLHQVTENIDKCHQLEDTSLQWWMSFSNVLLSWNHCQHSPLHFKNHSKFNLWYSLFSK